MSFRFVPFISPWEAWHEEDSTGCIVVRGGLAALFAAVSPQSMASLDVRGGVKCCANANVPITCMPMAGQSCTLTVLRCGMIGGANFVCQIMAGPCDDQTATCDITEQETCNVAVPCPPAPGGGV